MKLLSKTDMAERLDVSLKDFKIIAEKLGLKATKTMRRSEYWHTDYIPIFQDYIVANDIQTRSKQFDEAFEQGKLAYHAGVKISDNPHTNNALFKAWYHGWRNAKEIEMIKTGIAI